MLEQRKLSFKQLRQRKNLIGARGEYLAKNFLSKQDFEILDQNVRYKNYEADLVVFDKSTQEIVFVEVKVSSQGSFGHPSQRVDRRKINALYQLAKAYMFTKRLDHDFRFDIITLNQSQIELFENVTW